MWHQDDSCERQETQRLRVHSHRPGDRIQAPTCLQLRVTERTSAGVQVRSPPVKEGGEDADAEDAEGQDVEDVGQEHLPFAVKPVLTLLIADGSERRNCEQARRSR